MKRDKVCRIFLEKYHSGRKAWNRRYRVPDEFSTIFRRSAKIHRQLRRSRWKVTTDWCIARYHRCTSECCWTLLPLFFSFFFLSLFFFSSHLLITALYSVIFPCYGSGVFDFSKRYPKKWSFLPRNVVIQRVKSVSIVSYLFRSGERSETRKKRLERGKNTVVRRLPRVKLEKIKLR